METGCMLATTYCAKLPPARAKEIHAMGIILGFGLFMLPISLLVQWLKSEERYRQNKLNSEPSDEYKKYSGWKD